MEKKLTSTKKRVRLGIRKMKCSYLQETHPQFILNLKCN